MDGQAAICSFLETTRFFVCKASKRVKGMRLLFSNLATLSAAGLQKVGHRFGLLDTNPDFLFN